MNTPIVRPQRSTRSSKKQFNIKGYVTWLKSSLSKESKDAQTARLNRIFDRKNGPLNPQRRNEFATRAANEIRAHLEYLHKSFKRATGSRKRGMPAR